MNVSRQILFFAACLEHAHRRAADLEVSESFAHGLVLDDCLPQGLVLEEANLLETLDFRGKPAQPAVSRGEDSGPGSKPCTARWKVTRNSAGWSRTNRRNTDGAMSMRSATGSSASGWSLSAAVRIS